MRLSSTGRDRLVQTATGAGLALILAVLALASPTPAVADGHIPIAQQTGIVDGFDGVASPVDNAESAPFWLAVDKVLIASKAGE